MTTLMQPQRRQRTFVRGCLMRGLATIVAVLVVAGCEVARPVVDEPATPFPYRGEAVTGKIEAPLARHLEQVAEGDLVSVVVVMKRQLSRAEKVELFSRIESKSPAERKARQQELLTRELKRLARADQAAVLGYLREIEKAGQVRYVRPLWLSNVIGVTAPRSVVEQFTRFPEVKAIHLDIPRPVKGEVVWGVGQIDADDVWSLTPTACTGDGVTVAILDTGVDYTHVDLVNRMWINAAEDIDGDGQFTTADENLVDDDGNGYVDDVVGYNFSGAGNNDPADVGDHGTHVAGTVAGDGTGGSSIGVAPGARIMALRETTTAVLSTEQECWEGMQYALDNGADIVNFSSGWRDSWNPEYETWRSNVENLMDAGVLFVTIAHNDYNTIGTPNDVRTPGRVPLAVTLGATDDTDTIANFSNHGPITWQTVSPYFDYPWPPGLMKPDVSAPGVSVKSAQNGGGYVNGPVWSGTSMAAPHASGVAALLLEKDPGLSPYELKFLLEETALDLGDVGPDNSYGWGRINALDAVNYTIDTTPYDMSVTGTSAVWTSVDIWVDNDDDGNPDTPMALSNNHLYARARNLGGEVITDVELKFYFADVSTIGIGGFDPNGDGDPSDGNSTYIGSYRVPTMGPTGSDHDTTIGLVNWTIPTPPGTHWCVGIGIVAPSSYNAAEADTSNNVAFRNFFNIITSTTAFDFRIVPPAEAPKGRFAFELATRNLPKQARIELVVAKGLEKRLFADQTGFVKVEEPLLRLKPLGQAYFEALERSLPNVRYALRGEKALLSGIVSPDGESLPIKVVVEVPPDVEIGPDALIVFSTLDESGRRAGGLTLNLVKGAPSQKLGPYLPKTNR